MVVRHNYMHKGLQNSFTVSALLQITIFDNFNKIILSVDNY